MLAIDTSIEFARIADATAISELSRRHIEYRLQQRYTAPMIRRLIRHKAKNVVVVRKKKALIGFGIMSYGDDSANLDLLAIASGYRRRGVGRQVVEWLEKVALTAGIVNVFVQVRQSNRGAIRFYRKLGYQAVDEIKGYYQGREAAVIMGKSIRKIVGLKREA